MKQESLLRSWLGCVLGLGAMSSVTLAMAQVREPQVQPFERDSSIYVHFSNAALFTSVEELPTQENLDRHSETMARRAFDLSAVAITAQGEAFIADGVPSADPLHADAFRSMVGLVVDGYAGVLPGDAFDGAPTLSAEEVTDAEQFWVAESVLGTDERSPVVDTTRYPWSAIGRIDIGCTGTLIGPRHVLTAGHCVYNISTDEWYDKLDFSPGQSGEARPYGKIPWERVITVKGWTESHSTAYDYAMIVLEEPIGYTAGWLGFGYVNGWWVRNANIAGYPADKPSGSMWRHSCEMEAIDDGHVQHFCDTYGGMSGSGLYQYFEEGSRIIYAVHAYGGRVDNAGTRINEDIFGLLNQWRREYP